MLKLCFIFNKTHLIIYAEILISRPSLKNSLHFSRPAAFPCLFNVDSNGEKVAPCLKTTASEGVMPD